MPQVQIYETLDPGQYPARFKDVEERTSENGPYWRWEFTVTIDGEAHTVTGASSTTFSSRSKSYSWVCALLGRKPAGGENIEWADLEGLPCRLILDLSEDGEFNVIEKVLPPAEGGQSAPKADAPAF